MAETVRVVSDGEELVLSVNEAFRVHTKVDTRDLSAERRDAAAKRIAIQYLGFKDVKGRREYTLQAQQGDEMHRYTVWIEQAAFSRRQALLQDGPDICYQKLLHELAGSELLGSGGIEVTEGDLTAYRQAHTPPARRGFSAARTPEPAKALAASGGKREGIA